jgi:hypothetical protein
MATRLSTCWKILSTFTIRQRKHVILLCRAQAIVTLDPFNLLCIQTNLVQSPVQHPDPSYTRYFNFVINHRDLIESPTLSSILLDMCRSAPMSKTDVKDAKLASWGKEISICESPDVGPHLRFRCWFDPNHFNDQILPDVPPNPRMASIIHSALVRWRSKLQEKILYPRMSRKMISHATKREYERIFGREWVVEEDDGGVEMTQETLEKVYHEFGVELEGPCEIRQKWYTSGITPRTYFASGGTAYQKSKYIQEPASDLTAELSTTHPISRLNPARIQLRSSSHYLRIYDLTGFTSNHWECKYFLDELANFCYGFKTTIVDANEGLVQVDIGLLISEYNQSMNYRAEYSLERICDEFADVFEFHNRAGFLGVYGNINFSTFLHGASLLMVTHDTDEANVAGDDAHYCELPGHESTADRVIDANGYLEPTKTFRSDQVGAVCLKRGLIQVEASILPKIMLIFPSFANIGQLFGYSALQFSKKQMSGRDKLKVVGTELFRFFRGVFLSGIMSDLDIVIDIIRAIYHSASLPMLGSLPPFGDILIPACPARPSDLLDLSPLDVLLHYHFNDGVVLPKYIQDGEQDGSTDPPLYNGGQWYGTSSQKLRYLEVLEYVVKDEQTEILFGMAAYQRVVDVFSNVGRKEYLFHCIRDVPDFLISLPN